MSLVAEIRPTRYVSARDLFACLIALGGIAIGNFDVRRIVASDPHKEEAVRLLAEAFEHSPLFEFAFPAKGRRAALCALFEAIIDDVVRHGYAEAAFTDEVVGIFLWYPPGRYPMPLWRELRGLPSYLRMTLFAPLGLLKLYQVQRSLDRLRPRQPHCHAYFLAGRGSARITAILGRRMLAEADARSWPAYLETQSARTVTLYQRLGFEIQRGGLAAVPGAPPTWTMWRSPRPCQ